MAYRKLCAVALVAFGSVAVGCGKGNSTTARSTTGSSDQPPASADDPLPRNPDAPPNASGGDRPPGNADRPTGNPDAPGGGGRLRALCENICELVEEINECAESDLDDMGGQICQLCEDIPAGVAFDLPCADELSYLYDCILSLPGLCEGDYTPQQLAQCRDEAEAYGRCQQSQAPSSNDASD